MAETIGKNSFREFLAETSDLAGRELERRLGGNLRISTKADTSLVTEADLASERVILDRIRKYYPDDLIFSEEAGRSSLERPPGKGIWVVDPLDGTTNFANAYPFYCISIGHGRFDASGKVIIDEGAVYDAPRRRLFYARAGGGAWLDQKRLSVAAPRDFGTAFLVTGFYYQKGEILKAEIERFSRVAEKCQSIRRDGAAALDLAMVAEGVFDAFWEVGLQPWDVAAGSLLVHEAGGHVRNYQKAAGAPYDIEGMGIIAGSPGAVAAIGSLL